MQSKRSLLVGAAAMVLLAACAGTAGSAPAGSSESRELEVTKECSEYTGAAGDICTITSSNHEAIEVGSRVVYASAAGAAFLDSDIVLDAGPGNFGIGHCTLHLETGSGLCTFSDGTGTLAGLNARVDVSADSTDPTLWHWEGTHSLNSSD